MHEAKAAAAEAAVLAKIATWPSDARDIGERLHAICSAEGLVPRLWYGMPGYARSRSTPVLCFFRVDELMTFGLTEKARIASEAGAAERLVPCAWYLTGLDEATERRIAEIVRRAVA